MALSRACCLGVRAIRSVVLPGLQQLQTFSSQHVHAHLSPEHQLSSRQSYAQYGLAAADVVQQELEQYKVTVITGNLRGAGTHSPAWIQLIGQNGMTAKYQLGETDGGGFERGTTKSFTIDVPKDLGPLRRIHIEKRRDRGTILGEGWYLQQVEVEGPGRERTVFPCNSWLGESDCGGYVGAIERNLLPAAHTKPVDQYQPVHVQASGMSIPHPEKVVKYGMKGVNTKGFGHGGEDAYFFCEGRSKKKTLFGMGVADGVYMWRDKGIDSGLMSQALMEKAMHMVEGGTEDVFLVLSTAARYIQSEGMMGSTTACVLTINTTNGLLHAANLGDSGFLVYGPGNGTDLELKFRTNQLEHEFGRPYQIGHHEYANRPEDSDLVSFHVSKGDVIVMGTDGLLDNVSEVEIGQVLMQQLGKGASTSTLTQALVKAAFDASMDKRRMTPYSKGASDFFDMVYSGGKQDDITVLVAVCS